MPMLRSQPIFIAAFLAAALPAVAEQVGPVPFTYTSFERLPQNDADLHWTKFFHSEPELSPEGDGKAFAAHISIARPDSRQEIGVFYSVRACAPIASENGATISTCPARTMRFFSDGRVSGPRQINDICIVHRENASPTVSDFGWNAAQATFRVIDGTPQMTTSAVLNGHLFARCSFTTRLDSD